jgi:hypothetical protein
MCSEPDRIARLSACGIMAALPMVHRNSREQMIALPRIGIIVLGVFLAARK